MQETLIKRELKEKGAKSFFVRAAQLSVALPPELEKSGSEARYVDVSRFRKNGPARVILGRYGNVASEVRAPGGVNYLDVALKKGEEWRYEPPSGHTVAWAAVHEGELAAPAIGVGELAVFEEFERSNRIRRD
jgi:redox-sensitive bicupin YhaK (pirin superfamily)